MWYVVNNLSRLPLSNEQTDWDEWNRAPKQMAVEPLPDLDSELLISAFDGMVVSSASAPAPSEILSSSCASASMPGPSEEDELPDQHVEMSAQAESLFSSCDSASTPFIEYESHQVFQEQISYLIRLNFE